MSYENILIEKKEGLATLTINRPKKLNALNKATIEELHTAFETLEDDANIKVIIVTGSGEKAFVAGADISELEKANADEGYRVALFGQTVFNKFENS